MRQPRMTVPYGTWLVVNLLQRTDTFIQTSTEEFSLVDRDLGIDHIDEALTVDLFRRDDGQIRHGGKLFTVANQLNTPELIDDLAADLVNGLGQVDIWLLQSENPLQSSALRWGYSFLPVFFASWIA